jgi:anti-sigma regulatory factor (Ser/Thr protein kinase)
MAYSDQTMLHEVRAFVAAHGAAAGLRPEPIDDLCIVVNELAANTCEHTDRPGRLSMWVEPGIVACQVDDHGFISDPLTGRVPPSLNSTRGHGLLIVQSLCDLVRVYTADPTAPASECTSANEPSRYRPRAGANALAVRPAARCGEHRCLGGS